MKRSIVMVTVASAARSFSIYFHASILRLASILLVSGVLTQPSHAQIEPCYEGSSAAQEKWGLCDASNKSVVVAKTYGWIGEDPTNVSLFPAKDMRTSKYGYINSKGKWVIDPTYDRATMFDRDIAVVEIDGKNLGIAPDGRIKLDWAERYVSGFYRGYAYILDRPLKRYKRDYTCDLREWLGIPRLDCYKVDGLYGLVNRSGVETIKPLCEANSRILLEGVPRLNKGLMVCAQNGKFGLINTNGRYEVDPIYDWIYPPHDVMNDVIPGRASKVHETGFFEQTTQYFKINFNKANSTLVVTEDSIDSGRPKNRLSSEVFYVLTGFEKPFTFENYPFHVIGVLSGLAISIGFAVFLRIKGVPLYKNLPASIVVGVAGGFLAGVVTYVMLVLAALVIFIFMLYAFALARR